MRDWYPDLSMSTTISQRRSETLRDGLIPCGPRTQADLVLPRDFGIPETEWRRPKPG